MLGRRWLVGAEGLMGWGTECRDVSLDDDVCCCQSDDVTPAKDTHKNSRKFNTLSTSLDNFLHFQVKVIIICVCSSVSSRYDEQIAVFRVQIEYLLLMLFHFLYFLSFILKNLPCKTRVSELEEVKRPKVRKKAVDLVGSRCKKKNTLQWKNYLQEHLIAT